MTEMTETTETIEEKVIEIAKKSLGVERIDQYKEFANIPDIDSVELLEFVFQLEKKLNIKIPDDSIAKINNFQAAIELIKKIQAEKTAEQSFVNE